MPRMARKILLLATVLTAAGCGTMGNLSGRDKIYGGTQIDGTAVVAACKDIGHSNDAPQFTVTQVCEMLACCCIDLPLSVAADTVTLPITIPVSVYRWAKHPDEKPKTTPVETEVPTTSEIPATTARTSCRVMSPRSQALLGNALPAKLRFADRCCGEAREAKQSFAGSAFPSRAWERESFTVCAGHEMRCSPLHRPAQPALRLSRPLNRRSSSFGNPIPPAKQIAANERAAGQSMLVVISCQNHPTGRPQQPIVTASTEHPQPRMSNLSHTGGSYLRPQPEQTASANQPGLP